MTGVSGIVLAQNSDRVRASRNIKALRDIRSTIKGSCRGRLVYAAYITATKIKNGFLHAVKPCAYERLPSAPMRFRVSCIKAVIKQAGTPHGVPLADRLIFSLPWLCRIRAPTSAAAAFRDRLPGGVRCSRRSIVCRGRANGAGSWARRLCSRYHRARASAGD
jgi:hypothetical protein